MKNLKKQILISIISLTLLGLGSIQANNNNHANHTSHDSHDPFLVNFGEHFDDFFDSLDSRFTQHNQQNHDFPEALPQANPLHDADIVENKETNEYTIILALPGVKETEILIKKRKDVRNKSITVSVKKQNKQERQKETKSGNKIIVYERSSHSSFSSSSRTFSLPDHALYNKISWIHEDGKLTITVPLSKKLK